MRDQKIIEKELYSPVTLKQLLREAEDFCYEHGLKYDERKIMITTDYGSHVMIFYKDNN